MTLTDCYGSSVLCITLSKGEINSCMITHLWYFTISWRQTWINYC